MDLLQAFILGIIQGLTEFLPVSSSGHLVLMQKIFGLNEGNLLFNVCLHIATLIPVIIIFRKDLAALLKKPFDRLTWLLVAGTVPTVIIALLFEDFFQTAFLTGRTLGFGFIITGILMWYTSGLKNGNKHKETTKISDSVFIGIVQAIAILPAVSRSGSTLAGGLFRGLNREFALKFAFLLSIPAIIGAAVLEGYNLIADWDNTMVVSLSGLITGMLAAAISGYFAIRFMIKILLKGKLKMFSYYVFTIALLVLADQLIFNIFFDSLF